MVAAPKEAARQDGYLSLRQCFRRQSSLHLTGIERCQSFATLANICAAVLCHSCQLSSSARVSRAATFQFAASNVEQLVDLATLDHFVNHLTVERSIAMSKAISGATNFVPRDLTMPRRDLRVNANARRAASVTISTR
jgi:hypothetical protein